MVLYFVVLTVGGQDFLEGELREPVRLNTECFPLVSPNQTTSDLGWKAQLRLHVTVYKAVAFLGRGNL